MNLQEELKYLDGLMLVSDSEAIQAFHTVLSASIALNKELVGALEGAYKLVSDEFRAGEDSGDFVQFSNKSHESTWGKICAGVANATRLGITSEGE